MLLSGNEQINQLLVASSLSARTRKRSGILEFVWPVN
jgi:hypothetical protein